MKSAMPFLTRNISRLAMLAVVISALVACKTITSSDTVDYKRSSGEVRGPNLSYPPDLITAQADRHHEQSASLECQSSHWHVIALFSWLPQHTPTS